MNKYGAVLVKVRARHHIQGRGTVWEVDKREHGFFEFKTDALITDGEECVMIKGIEFMGDNPVIGLLVKHPPKDEAQELRDEVRELKDRLRRTAQILVDGAGSQGPMDAEDAALRAVSIINNMMNTIKDLRDKINAY